MTRDITVLDYLDRSVKEKADSIAFADDDSQYTYKEIDELSDRIATALIEKDLGFNVPVAVLVERNVHSIIMFLGIIKSHCFYVPIDSSLPAERILAIFGKMEPRAVLHDAGVNTEVIGDTGLVFLSYGDLIASHIDERSLRAVRKQIINSDPLLAICTSGSTGVPKGVIKSHRTVLEFIPTFVKTFGFTEDDVFGNQAPFDFDVSLKDIYTTLYLGAKAYVIPKKAFLMPKTLIDRMEEYKISVLVWSASALCVVAGVNAFKYKIPSYLKKVLFSGEAMPVKLLNVWRKYLPEIMYVNLYGPSEITGNILYYVVDREFAETEKLPLGKEFANTRVLILDEDDQPAKRGGRGEICAITPSMADGYYRDKEKTALSFVQNPLNEYYPERMYRTGDIAEIDEDGTMYFAGRKDFQIKHMGHRIELEEIELNINAIDGVSRSCCLFDKDRNKIVAFYVGEPDKRKIVSELNRMLPKYMIPSIFNQLEEMPLNKNGKIDRQKIRESYESSAAGD